MSHYQSFVGALCWFVYYVYLPQLFAWQLTALINSGTHIWGVDRYSDAMSATCKSKNVWWLWILIFGDAFHNNHHAVPNTVGFGVHWYEIDVVFIVYRLLEKAGFVFGHNEHPPMDHLLKTSSDYFGEAVGLVISAVVLLIGSFSFLSTSTISSRRRMKAKIEPPIDDAESGGQPSRERSCHFITISSAQGHQPGASE